MEKEILGMPSGSHRHCHKIDRQHYAISVPQKPSSDHSRMPPITQGDAQLL